MKNHLHILLAISLVSLTVQAEEVGRTSFDLPGPEWKLLTTFQTKTVFTGGATAGSSEPVDHKVLYLLDGHGTVKAMLFLSSQRSKYGLITWTGTNCPAPKKHYFTRDFDSNQHGRTLECLIVSSRYSPRFKPDSPISKALAERQLALFKSGYYLQGLYGSDSGAHLRVELATTASFKGSPGVPSTAETFDVPPELVAWGESLQKAVKSSVHSFRGRLDLPPIEFRE